MSALKKSIIENLPSWLPRSVMTLNDWLDKAVEAMLAQEIDVMSSMVDLDKDSSEIVSMATLRSSEMA